MMDQCVLEMSLGLITVVVLDTRNKRKHTRYTSKVLKLKFCFKWSYMALRLPVVSNEKKQRINIAYFVTIGIHNFHYKDMHI